MVLDPTTRFASIVARPLALLRSPNRLASTPTRPAGSAPRRTAPESGLRIDSSHALSGSYSDQTVEELATEDGEARTFTREWGKENRSPRGIESINRAAEVGTDLIDHQLHGALEPAESTLERMAAEAPLAEHAVMAAADETEDAEIDREMVAAVCRARGLALPDHHWRRMAGEVLGLAMLAIGDLYFNSRTFEVFGMSDRPIGIVPFNELQLVASSTVVALLLLARLAGHMLATLRYYLETSQSGTGPVGGMPSRVGTSLEAVGALVAVGGALGILVGLSQVRSSYLAQSGVSAHASQFLLIQVGIAVAGIALSYWLAHPFDRAWRAVSRQVERARAGLDSAYGTFMHLEGEFNALDRQRVMMLLQHRDWAAATVTDTRRLAQMYARRVLLAQPEPTTDALLPDELPGPATPDLISEVAKYLAGKDSEFKQYPPLNSARVTGRLADLDRRRTERLTARTAPLMSRGQGATGGASAPPTGRGRRTKK